jgi:predicted N-acetyltransferase YhbS
MIQLTKTGPVDEHCELAADVRMLLNAAYPDGAPNELDDYYSKHGFPTTTILLSENRRALGHLAIFERQIRIGDESEQVGLIGEVAVAVDSRGSGLARRLVRHAHEHLRGRSIPYAILFAFEPRVYASSGYSLMQNETRFLDPDGQWKSCVLRGSMVAELLEKRWPNRPIDLCGPAV